MNDNKIKINADTLKKMEHLFSILTSEDDSIKVHIETSLRNVNPDILCRKSAHAFSEIEVIEFRGLENIKINNLSQMNLFVGDNNSGKTSLLESIYLLTQMNDLNEYINIERFRAKVDEYFSPIWMEDYIDEHFEVKGIFDSQNINVIYNKEKDESLDIDKQGYLTTMNIIANKNNENYNMRMHLYEREPAASNAKSIVHLCPSSFSSAYRRNKKTLLDAHSTLVKDKKLQLVKDFIIKSFPNEMITSIDLDSNGKSNRFMISSKKFPKAQDISKFGEGLQRVWEISLYTMSCSGGCAFVDEIDSGVHKSLLDSFIKFIAELCKEYNVQLFATTHNRECVDSFVITRREPLLLVKSVILFR